MKETLEKLWNDYLLDECATMDSDEERALTKKMGELHEQANRLLNESQQKAVEAFVEAAYDLEALFVKKAFFRECEFAVSFLLESRNFGK